MLIRGFKDTTVERGPGPPHHHPTGPHPPAPRSPPIHITPGDPQGHGCWFVFVIGHPCVLVPDAVPALRDDARPAVTITGCFEERFWRSANPHGVRRAGNHHRMLGTYLNGLVRAGFVFDAVDEPRPSARLVEQQPLYAEVPIFFAARAFRRD